MDEANRSAQIVRFGIFELDLRAGELRRNGAKIRLQEQPFQIITLLLERPGEVVTREELRTRLWPADTFVDFDHSLNAAVRRLRDALGDDADNPRFVETLPRRGYRFIGPVDKPTNLAFALGALSESSSPPVAGIDQGSRSRWAWTIAAAAMIVLAAVLVAWWKSRNAVPVVESITQLTDDGERKQPKLVSDGSRIYFNEGQTGSLKIAQVSVTGGRTALVETRLANPWIVGLSPEGSAILALVGGFQDPAFPIWSIPLPAGDPRRLGSAEVVDAAFFPDGRILLAKGTDLYVAENDGSNPRKLVSFGDNVGDPSVSPDGQRIVFTMLKGTNSLVESAADGTGLHTILNASHPVCCGTWSSDGKYLVYRTFNREESDLWALPMQRGLFHHSREPIRLATGPLSYSGILPSRDGKQIFVIGTKQRGELVRYDTNSRQFLPFLSGISAIGPTFSRDGKWVAYTSYPDHTLWRSRSDGTERMELTYPPMTVTFPFISPDGRRVAFATTHSEIYVIGMDGGVPQKIIERNSSGGLWSPDGNLLALTSWTDAPAGEKNSLYLRIFDLRTRKTSVVPSSQGTVGGAWVTQDVLVAANEDTTKFLTFDFKTQKWTEIAGGTFVNWAVSRDGKYLYFTTGGAEPKAQRLRFADRQIETITSLKDLRRVVDSAERSTQIDVAPDGSPVFTRDIGTQEIYALNVRWP